MLMSLAVMTTFFNPLVAQVPDEIALPATYLESYEEARDLEAYGLFSRKKKDKKDKKLPLAKIAQYPTLKASDMRSVVVPHETIKDQDYFLRHLQEFFEAHVHYICSCKDGYFAVLYDPSRVMESPPSSE